MKQVKMKTQKKLKIIEAPLITEHIKKNYTELNIDVSEFLNIERSISLMSEDELNALVGRVYKEVKYRNRLLRYISAHSKGTDVQNKYSSIGVSVEAKKEFLDLKNSLGFKDLDMSSYICKVTNYLRSEKVRNDFNK
jgi:hypothetical protein